MLSLKFVDYGLYFVQDENNFIYPLLQVGSSEKSIGSGRPKIIGSGSSPLIKTDKKHFSQFSVLAFVSFFVLGGSWFLQQEQQRQQP